MPLYMDIHKHVEGLTANAVAEAHQKDVETQGKHGVEYLQYWYNDKDGTVFCLVKAPSKEAAEAVHREAHGLVADELIEVNEGVTAGQTSLHNVRTMMSTEATLTHHLQAFGQIGQGIDPIMSDYTDESVLFTPDGPIKGLAGIREFLATFRENSPPELIQAVTVTRQDVEGEMAYIIWQAVPFIPFATDTFVIRDGKILYQSFAVLAPASGGV